jgi:hypothetical protein
MLRHLAEIADVPLPDDEIDRHVEAEVAAPEPEADLAPSPVAWWAADDWFYRDEYLAGQLD